MGQLFDPGPRLRLHELLQRLADPAVEPRPPRRAQLLVERRPDERVAERELRGATAHLAHQGCGRRLVEGVEDRVLARLGYLRQQRHVELAADHGGQAEHTARSLREPAEPPPDHLTHALGDTKALDRAAVRPAPALLKEHARLAEMPQNLADEERIPLRLLP